jgi:Tol biopolymer transport system component
VRRLALALAALVLPVFPAGADAAFPGANGKIAYAYSNQIRTINPDGSGLTVVRDAGRITSGPIWSPDGTKLVFAGEQSGASRGVRIVDADGSGEHFVIGGFDSPAWSPDGRKLVIEQETTCAPDGSGCSGGQIYTINVDGTDLFQVTGRPGAQVGTTQEPEWSPDGTKIAFSTFGTPPGFGGYNIYTIRPDGTDLHAVTTDGDFYSRRGGPSWSPDGRRLAYTSEFVGSSSNPYSVFTVNADGSDRRSITDGLWPDWSPDGSKLAFIKDLNPDPYAADFRLHVINTDRSGLTQVPGADSFIAPHWQPLPGSYTRPKGASTEWVSLVPAYEPCNSPNSTHSSPLAAPSCNPPVPVSDHLTIGTADSNRKPTKSNGSLLAEVQAGNPGTAADEADVKLTVDLKDIRNKSDLSDYTGELAAQESVRITDRYNGYGGGSATAQDLTYSFAIPCAATDDTTIGAECALTTTADTLVPGTIREGKRAVWDLGELRLFDGGSDGLASTGADNTLFEVQGIFVP